MMSTSYSSEFRHQLKQQVEVFLLQPILPFCFLLQRMVWTLTQRTVQQTSFCSFSSLNFCLVFINGDIKLSFESVLLFR